jgi:hypothetical protein
MSSIEVILKHYFRLSRKAKIEHRRQGLSAVHLAIMVALAKCMTDGEYEYANFGARYVKIKIDELVGYYVPYIQVLQGLNRLVDVGFFEKTKDYNGIWKYRYNIERPLESKPRSF